MAVPPHQPPVVDQHLQHLFDEQRIPFRGGCDPPSRGCLEACGPEKVRDQRRALVVGEGLQLNGGGGELAAAPRRTGVQQLLPGQADQQDGRAPRPVGQVIDQVQEGGLRPVEVVEHQDQGALGRHDLERSPNGPEGFLGGRGGGRDAHQAGDLTGERRSFRILTEQPPQLDQRLARGLLVGDGGGVLEGLRQRPERDAVPIGETPAVDDERLRGGGREELVDQPGLAHAGRAEDREEIAHALRYGLLERLVQEAALALAAHHRRIKTSRVPAGAGPDRDQAERRDRLGLALQRQRLDGLCFDRVADQPMGRGAEQDLARRRGLFQPCGHVHRVPGDQPLPRRLVPGHDLTGVDSGADHDGDAAVAFELLVQDMKAVAHLGRGADRPHRVVLVQARNAEHGHHGIADELLHDASVRLHCVAHLVEVPGHDPTEGLGVEPLTQGRRAGHVGEHNRDGLADLALRGRLRGERGSAGQAEPSPFGVLLTANLADHRPSLGKVRGGRGAVRPTDGFVGSRCPCNGSFTGSSRPASSSGSARSWPRGELDRGLGPWPPIRSSRDATPTVVPETRGRNRRVGHPRAGGAPR